MHHAKRGIAFTKAPLKTKKYSIVIPAAGQGTRMGSYGPKALIKIGGESLISRQIKAIKKHFHKHEIVLVSGFHSERLMNTLPDDIISIENENYAQTNVARSIAMGLRACTTDRVLICYGDLVFHDNLLQMPFDRDSAIVTCHSMPESDVGCITHNNLIENLGYIFEDKWAQVVYLTGRELRLMKTIAWNRENSKQYGFELLNKVIQKGGKFKPFFTKCPIRDIDTPKDIAIAEALL